MRGSCSLSECEKRTMADLGNTIFKSGQRKMPEKEPGEAEKENEARDGKRVENSRRQKSVSMASKR